MIKKAVAFLLVLALLLPLAPALAVRYYRVDTSRLKAREKPSFKAAVVNSYRRDFAVTIERRGTNGWSRVRFRPGGAQVYVRTQYLKACSSYTAYISADGTALRTGPAASFRSSAKLDTGAKVTVLTHGVSYDYVSSAKGKGYVRNSSLTKKKPSAVTAYLKNYEGKRVCLRKGPGTKYKTIADYPSGTKVKVLSYGSTWCKVSVNGRTGYMKTIFIHRVK